MPFVPNTPESLINRSDSKNPATTCKGIKIDGKHCRRDIAAQKSPGIRRASKTGVVAILPAGDEEHDGAAAYFCWQHKDQAVPLATVGKDGRRADIISLQKRTSVDTLAERLGILSVEDDTNTNGKPKRKRKRHGGRPARKETLPQAWQGIDGQLLAVPERDRPATRPSREKTKPRKKEPSLLSLFCCISSVDVEPPPPPRQRYSSYEKKASVPVQRPSTPRTSGIHGKYMSSLAILPWTRVDGNSIAFRKNDSMLATKSLSGSNARKAGVLLTAACSRYSGLGSMLPTA